MSDKTYFENAYFIIGTAYAGKSTMVKVLAKRHSGIACFVQILNRLTHPSNGSHKKHNFHLPSIL